MNRLERPNVERLITQLLQTERRGPSCGECGQQRHAVLACGDSDVGTIGPRTTAPRSVDHHGHVTVLDQVNGIGSALVKAVDHLIDRNTATVSLGEAWVTVFGSLRIPAEVVYLHPVA